MKTFLDAKYELSEVLSAVGVGEDCSERDELVDAIDQLISLRIEEALNKLKGDSR